MTYYEYLINSASQLYKNDDNGFKKLEYFKEVVEKRKEISSYYGKRFVFPGSADLTGYEIKEVIRDYQYLVAHVNKPEWNQEDNCKGIIESVIAYEWSEKDKEAFPFVRRVQKSLDKHIDIFGINQVCKWTQEIIDKVDHIEKNVSTDCEGLSYNGIVWKE